MASPGNPNTPGGGPFDLQNLFKAPASPSTFINNASDPNFVSSTFTSSSSSSSASCPPPPGTGAVAAYAYPQLSTHYNHNPPPPYAAPYSNHLPPHQDFANAHPQRSTPMFQYPQSPQQPSNFRHNPALQNPNNHGARLMALLNTPPPAHEIPQQLGMPSPQVHATLSTGSDLCIPQMGISYQGSSMMRMASNKFPRGRHLVGDRLVYDIDVRLPGELQPQLEVTPITKYNSDPGLVLGRQIAVNRTYICYGLKQGAIRVLNINTALRSLLKGLAQRVTDLAFFAEDVQLLASASADGRVYVWKVSEGPDEEEKPQITGRIVIAIQITGEGQNLRPIVCWHCHKQEVLVVGIGRCVLKIDTTKVGKGEKFSAEEPLKCPIGKLIGGVQLVGTHDGEVADLSMCQWMTTRLASASVDGTIKIWEDRKLQPIAVLQPHNGHPVNSVTFLAAPHQPDHIILITGGPLNREVKIWISASEEGWLLPSDSESWHCTQTLELKSSEACVEEAFFNQITALPQAGLLLLANAKKNAIYAVHLEYGPNPVATCMDYIAEFTVTMPILSFTGTSELLPHGEQIGQVYCVQTQAIQQYALDLSRCLPPPLENVIYDKLESSASLDASCSEQLARTSSIQECGLESASTMIYPVSIASVESLKSAEFTSCVETKSVALSEVAIDGNIPSSVAAPPPLPLSPRLSKTLSSFRSSISDLDLGSSIGNPSLEPKVVDYPVERQKDVINRNISRAAPLDNGPQGDCNKLSQDDSMSLNHETKFKSPTHLVTPAEILMANSASDLGHNNEPKTEVELKFQDVVTSHSKRNVEMDEKAVNDTRSNRNDDIEPQQKHQNFVLESKKKSFFSQASDLGIEMAQECCTSSRETNIHEEVRQFNGPDENGAMAQQSTIEEVLESLKDVSGTVMDSSIPIPAQQSARSVKGKKQKGKGAQGSASPLPSTLNSIDTSIEPNVNSNALAESAFMPQIFSVQEKLDELMTMQQEMQKQMAEMIAFPVTKESKRLEVAVGRSMEKVVKANADALWIRFQEENTKQDKAARERMQQITNMISNCLNKELPSIVDKAVKRDLTALGQSVARTVTPTIERTISASIAESFQKGIGDKAVNQLEKSVNSKLEATVARQIQAQFQTSGKQALQDTLKSSLEASVVPAFEMSCRAMFEQVDAAFQKGMVEHISVTQQQYEASHTPLAIALRDAINSVSSMTQTLSSEILDGQRKLLAIAAAEANSKAANPLVTQLSNGPLGGLHEKLELPVDPTKELSRLVAERKYEEAFTAALQRSDVSIVSWLCSQVDIPAILSMNPLPLSEGVRLSLLQQLACDISKETPRKLTWMRDILSSINPADPVIMMHVRPIFEQVYQILNHHRSLPTTSSSELANVRLIMHVINSMLMTSK